MRLMIIPARSGSKRVADKNIRMIGEYPLVVRTIMTALKNSLPILFTSDSQRYIDVVKDYVGNKIEYELRPPELAKDNTRVVEEVSRICKKYDAKNDDLFGLMLPTSPFRSANSLEECLTRAKKYDRGIFSAVEYSFPISFAFNHNKSNNNNVPSTWSPVFGADSPMISGNTRSQNQKKCYHPTGGIYIFKYSDFKNNLNLYNNASPYILKEIEAMDIDTEFDFELASIIAKNEKMKK
jgi:CMP-N-acetylneuraminic acid synthetase